MLKKLFSRQSEKPEQLPENSTAEGAQNTVKPEQLPENSPVEGAKDTVNPEQLPKKSTAEGAKNTIVISDAEALGELFGYGGNKRSVTPTTAMKVSIVFACLRLICGAIAQMRVKLYEENNGDRSSVHDAVLSLLNLEPSPIWSASVFWEYITACMLLQGDGFAIILRNRNGDPVEILPVSPLDVSNQVVNGRMQYYISLNGVMRGFDQDDILHFPGFGFNGLRSMSVIRWGAFNSIELEMKMEDYSKDFFDNGAHQSVAIVKQGRWDEPQKESIRNSYVKTYGGQDKKRFPLVLDSTSDIKELSINAKDSQLLESREFQITDIARSFGVPSFMVNQEQKTTSFGSGVGEISLSFLRYTLMPHIRRFEDELNRKLFKYKPYLSEFNTAAIMRGTLKERNDAYRQSVGGSQGPGWLTINEVRRLENLPRIDDATFDKPYNPTQLPQQKEAAPDATTQ